MKKTQSSIINKTSGVQRFSKHFRGFKFGYIFLAAILLSSTFASFIAPASPAQAAYIDLDARERARSYGYYRALDYCVTKMNTGIAASSDYDGQRTDPMNGYWFAQGGDDPSGGNPVDVVPYKSGLEGGRTGCADAVRTALNKYWDISYVDFLKGIGYSWDATKSQWIYSNKNGSRPDQLKSLLNSKNISTNWTDAIAYNVYLITFGSACKANDVVDSETNKTLANEKKSKSGSAYTWIYNLSVGGTARTVYTYTPKTSTTNYGQGATSTEEATVTLYQGNQKKCSEIASLLGNQRFANAGYDALLTDKCRAAGVPVVGRSADGQRSACIDGAKNKDNQDYCRKYAANPSHQDACKKGQGVTVSAGDIPSTVVTGSDGDSEGTSSCRVESIGWILCPVINAMAGMADAAFNLVAAFMKVEPLGFNTDNPLYSAWSIMRNLANIAFVIAFLIIIFSQLTGAGLSNYGVKKMLPRLVVAAVLVNISYFICAIAVDISNILGFSTQQVLHDMSNQVVGEDGEDLTKAWSNIAVSVLSLGALGAAAGAVTAAVSSVSIWALLAGLLPLLVTALFALMIAFLVLLARQAFIIILIVVSPLAFIAFLLPNTEGLFKKWRGFFVTLLALFPLMALVFGGSVLASAIMRQGSETMDGNAALAFFMYLGSVAILALPFFVTPLLIKLSSGVLNRFAGFVNNSRRGPFDRLRKGAERLRDNSRNNSYASKLSNGRKVFGAGARWRNRRGITDQVAKSNVDVAEAGSVITDRRAGELSGQLSSNQLAANAINSAKSAKITTGLANGNNASVITALGAAGGDSDVEKALAAQTSKAVSEAINDAKLSAAIKPGDIASMGREFQAAVQGGDTIKARAMQDMMLKSGGPGINAWRDNVAQLEERNELNADMRQTLQKRVLDENPGIKAQDASIMSWATDNKDRTLAAIRADKGTWGVSNVEFAGMKASAQRDAINTGIISKERALEISESEAFGNMDEGVKVIIRNIRDSSPTFATDSNGVTTPVSQGSMSIPHTASQQPQSPPEPPRNVPPTPPQTPPPTA